MSKLTNACLVDFINTKKIDNDTANRIREKARSIAKKSQKYKFNKESIDNNPELLREAAFSIIKEKQREKLVDALAIKKYEEVINNYKTAYELTNDPRLAASSILADIDGFRATGVIPAERYMSGRKKVYYSQFSNFVNKASSGLFDGNKGKVNELKFVQELYNKGSGGDPNITKLAEEWQKLNDFMVEDFISVGGNIEINKNWRMPQTHDATRLVSKGREAWINEIKNKLDWEEMTDEFGNTIPDSKREQVLSDVYDTIATGGVSKQIDPEVTDKGVEGIKQGGRAALRNKYNEERFLIFKDAESQIAYNDAFGRGTIADSIFGHIDNVSMETGLMDALGPKPDTTLAILKQMSTVRGAVAKDQTFIDKLYREVNKDARAVADTTVASTFSLFRGIGILGNVGSIMISALADIPNSAVAAGKFGFDNKFGVANRLFKQPIKVVNTMTKQTFDREQMVRINGNVEYALYQNQRFNRFGDLTEHSDIYDINPNQSKFRTRFENTVNFADAKVRGLSNWLYKRSLLTDFTEAGKNIAIREAMDIMTINKTKNWEDIPSKQREALMVSGFNKEDMKLLRNVETENINGVESITIDSILNSNLPRADKMKIHTKLNAFGEKYAKESIPEAGSYIRAKTSAQGNAGDWGAELVQTFMQFKRFPVTYLHNQILGDIRAGKTKADAIGNLAIRGFYGMSFGMAAVQLSEISNNRTPKEVSWELVADGFFKSGGAGILGDVLFTDYSKHGRDLLDYAAGPSGSMIVNLARGKGKLGNTLKEMLGFEIEKGAQTFDLDAGDAIDLLDEFADNFNLFYTKAVVDITIDKLLRENFDDDYREKKRRQDSKLKESNQDRLID